MHTTKEQALVGLQNAPKNVPGLKSFFNAIIEGKLPNFYLETFRRYRGYSDVLVSDYESGINQSNSDNQEIKAKGNVIWSISSSLSSAVLEGTIKDDELAKQIAAFCKREWNYSKGKKWENFTSPEELKLINAMLDTVIGYLKTAYSLE